MRPVSGPITHLLIRLARTRRFRARWTADIHNQWIEAVLKNRSDLKREQLERTVDLMEKAVPGSQVTGYESLIDGLELPDPDDRHVLAAAIHPDDFIMDLAELEPQLLEIIAKQQRVNLANPPIGAKEFVDNLEHIPMTMQQRRPGIE